MNVWADIFERWSATPIIRRLVSIQNLISKTDKEFKWHSASELAKVQAIDSANRPTELT